MEFSVVLDEEALKLDLTYEWKTDKGKIFKGQGTNKIIVTTDGLENVTLTAKVKVKGLSEECRDELVETGIVTQGGHPYPIDDFGKMKKKDVRARIDAFIAELQNTPNSIGVIVQYGKAKAVRKREKIIRKRFKFRGFDLGKITFIYKRKEDKGISTRLWRIPKDADPSGLY